MNQYDAYEISYKNGFSAALEETSLRQIICDSLQKTNLACDTVCKRMCGSDGNCAFCGTLVRGIREARGVQ